MGGLLPAFCLYFSSQNASVVLSDKRVDIIFALFTVQSCNLIVFQSNLELAIIATLPKSAGLELAKNKFKANLIVPLPCICFKEAAVFFFAKNDFLQQMLIFCRSQKSWFSWYQNPCFSKWFCETKKQRFHYDCNMVNMFIFAITKILTSRLCFYQWRKPKNA